MPSPTADIKQLLIQLLNEQAKANLALGVDKEFEGVENKKFTRAYFDAHPPKTTIRRKIMNQK